MRFRFMGDVSMMDGSKAKTSLPPTELNHSNGSAEGRIISAVQRLLVERSIDACVYPDDNLFQAGLNSLDMLNLVLSLEAEFDITIPEAEITIANLRTISTLSTLVSRLTNKLDAVFAK